MQPSKNTYSHFSTPLTARADNEAEGVIPCPHGKRGPHDASIADYHYDAQRECFVVNTFCYHKGCGGPGRALVAPEAMPGERGRLYLSWNVQDHGR